MTVLASPSAPRQGTNEPLTCSVLAEFHIGGLEAVDTSKCFIQYSTDPDLRKYARLRQPAMLPASIKVCGFPQNWDTERAVSGVLGTFPDDLSKKNLGILLIKGRYTLTLHQAEKFADALRNGQGEQLDVDPEWGVLFPFETGDEKCPVVFGSIYRDRQGVWHVDVPAPLAKPKWSASRRLLICRRVVTS